MAKIPQQENIRIYQQNIQTCHKKTQKKKSNQKRHTDRKTNEKTRDEDPTFFSLDPDKLKKNPDPTLIRNEDLINHNFRIEFDDSGLYFIFFTLR